MKNNNKLPAGVSSFPDGRKYLDAIAYKGYDGGYMRLFKELMESSVNNNNTHIWSEMQYTFEQIADDVNEAILRAREIAEEEVNQ